MQRVTYTVVKTLNMADDIDENMPLLTLQDDNAYAQKNSILQASLVVGQWLNTTRSSHWFQCHPHKNQPSPIVTTLLSTSDEER